MTWGTRAQMVESISQVPDEVSRVMYQIIAYPNTEDPNREHLTDQKQDDFPIKSGSLVLEWLGCHRSLTHLTLQAATCIAFGTKTDCGTGVL
jgi:hypothetical protein